MAFTARSVFRLASLPPSATSAAATNTLQEIASNQPGGVAKVVLKKGKTQLFGRGGSSMVYSGAVDRIIGRPHPKTGDVVLVADGTQKPIGWGFYNSVSMFCVRLMQLEDEASRELSCALNVEELLETRIFAAAQLRNSLGLPSLKTNAYRLINSEGDRLSGLIVDIFGDIAVVASSAAWVEKYRPLVESCISRINEVKHISWRPSVEILKEEGLDYSSSTVVDLVRPPPERVKVMENGISYMVSMDGQKTGFYADQRDNRWFISTISEGRRVLDICCYTGGFALNAAFGGASDVTGVDSSLPALDVAKENIDLNGMGSRRTSFVRQDASEFMKDALSKHEKWDIVVLDPPKLAPRKKVLKSASGMYSNLNSLAMLLTKRGGLLMTCSCSGAMTQSGMFLEILQGAAAKVGKKITVVRKAGAACDHPLDPAYPEGEYLTNILLRVV